MSRMEYLLNMFKVLYSRFLRLTGITFSFTPLIHGTVMKILGHQDFERYLPIKAIYPFDMYASPYYEILYVVMLYPVFITSYASVGFDLLFFDICRALCDEFDIIKHCVDSEDKKNIMSHHSKVLKIADEFKELFAPIIFIQFIEGSLALCVSGFQLVMSDVFAQKIVVTFLGVALMMQLFFYSLFSEFLKSKSESAADLCYIPDRDYILFIMRSHRSVVIKGGFYYATLETFNNIVKTAGSLIALLQSFEE
ncbi:CLUMA_CG015610, isoform A [Clunio marinus]|uniref:CLUMA_CG015610, isoform A n=1 Tax=Clunio marinus TaxID=568069 RepID=A0A1J1IPE5_9DIPT|nr:CLUMA_CG015610, isoform A [Clunio marinus]